MDAVSQADFDIMQAMSESEILAKALGAHVARLTKASVAMISNPEDIPAMCSGCAYREGTEANTSPGTLALAVDCAVSGEWFWCHAEQDAAGDPVNLCSGWIIARASMGDTRMVNNSMEDTSPLDEDSIDGSERIILQPEIGTDTGFGVKSENDSD